MFVSVCDSAADLLLLLTTMFMFLQLLHFEVAFVIIPLFGLLHAITRTAQQIELSQPVLCNCIVQSEWSPLVQEVAACCGFTQPGVQA